MQIMINVAGKEVAKTIGKEALSAGAKIAIGVGCEVAIYCISRKIINNIEAKSAEKKESDELEEAGIYDEPADYE